MLMHQSQWRLYRMNEAIQELWYRKIFLFWCLLQLLNISIRCSGSRAGIPKICIGERTEALSNTLAFPHNYIPRAKIGKLQLVNNRKRGLLYMVKVPYCNNFNSVHSSNMLTLTNLMFLGQNRVLTSRKLNRQLYFPHSSHFPYVWLPLHMSVFVCVCMASERRKIKVTGHQLGQIGNYVEYLLFEFISDWD